MLLVDYIFKPLDTTDVSIALMLTGAVYLFGSILSFPSAILTGISFILISPHFSRLPTIILTSLVGCISSGIIISFMFDSRIEQFILFATVGLLNCCCRNYLADPHYKVLVLPVVRCMLFNEFDNSYPYDCHSKSQMGNAASYNLLNAILPVLVYNAVNLESSSNDAAIDSNTMQKNV